MLDGKLMGYVDRKIAQVLVNSLREIKITQNKTDERYSCVPKTMEIAYLPPSDNSATSNEGSDDTNDSDTKEKFFPGIFLATTPSRFVRPVKNLESGGIEFIGPLEQVNLSIACLEEDLRTDSTHQEMDPINMLSIIASTIPFADYNQSPRNMYQC
jgi:DNA-directed RNA polymerase I subunit RPA2